MNTMTTIVLAILIVVIIGAIIGTRYTMKSESCCSDDKNCSCGQGKKCSIRRENKE